MDAAVLYSCPLGDAVGNLALFYRDSEYALGLVKLGTIDSGTEILAAIDDEFTVTIDIADGDTA